MLGAVALYGIATILFGLSSLYWLSLFFFAAVVVGGLASVGGSLAGAAVLAVIEAETSSSSGWEPVILGAAVIVILPEALRAFDQVRMLAFGIGLIVLMLLRPQGLWPSRIGQIERRAVATSEASAAAGVSSDTPSTTG